MLAIIGLGLYDLRDLSVGALETLRKCSRVYLECYTSIVPMLDKARLEALAGRGVTALSRSDIEGETALRILEEARVDDVALLVPGDPFIATTHIALKVEAARRGVRVVVFHAPSILNAVPSSAGLQIYKMGRPVTIVRPSPLYFPETPYNVLAENLARGLHTMFFLDLDVESGYAMTASEAVEVLVRLEEKKGRGIVCSVTPFIVVARATSPDEAVGVYRLGEAIDVGPPPHTLVVPGLLDPVEMEALEVFAGASRSLLEEWQRFLRSRLPACDSLK